MTPATRPAALIWPLVVAHIFLASDRRAAAWTSPGHMIIALAAYDQMTPETRAAAVALLRAHPRFDDHFDRAMPYEVRTGSDAERDEWVFAYAATWPDVVRSDSRGVTRIDVQRYNRPWWHFVDLPLYLSREEERKLAPTVRMNLDRTPPSDPDDAKMNVIQALKNSTQIVGDATAAAELRSVHLCWVLHLVGDSHQPLHSTALFTSRRFPEGDHGGNYFFHSREYTLHNFWDEQISIDEPYATHRLAARQLLQNAELQAAARRGAENLDPGAWIDQGHELAKKFVYAPEIVAQIAAREGHTHLGPLHPSPQYAADAERVAESQAAVAGARLAAVLNKRLK